MSMESLRVLTRLSIARRANLDEEHLQVFVEELLDEPVDILGLACRELAREPRKQFGAAFPTLGDIRAKCDAVRIQQREQLETNLRALAPPPSREPTYFCLDCYDEPSGFRVLACLGSGAWRNDDFTSIGVKITRPCGRPKDHPAHTYAEKCSCVDHNPVIAQHRHRMQESARRRGATE